MKKTSLYIMAAVLPLFLLPSSLKADNGTNTAVGSVTTTVDNKVADVVSVASDISAEATDASASSAANTKDAEIANAQVARLKEIKAMDFSTMSRAEKKLLRTEVASIQKAQNQRGDGYGNHNGRHHGGSIIYIGSGGLLIIILLILLL
jgi:hypothetical protein